MDAFARLKEKFRTEERCVEASCKDDEITGPDATKVYPPSRAQIGRSAWRYLHAMAANSDAEPAISSSSSSSSSATSQTKTFTPEKQSNLRDWLVSFVQFYPCQHCAESFVDIITQRTPDFSNVRNYSQWWIWAHNMVRVDLSQPILVDPDKDLDKALDRNKKGLNFT